MATADEIIGIIDANLNGHGRVVYEAAKNAGFEIALNEEGRLDLADACALVDHESAGGQNIFGCDQGGLFCNEAVTAQRVAQLLQWVANGGNSNGIGLAQLTHPSLIDQAENRGGAHLPEHQCSVGFEYLKSLVDDLDYMYGIAAYNAGPGNASLGISNGYYGKIQAQREKWKNLLAGLEMGFEPVVKKENESDMLTAVEGTKFYEGLRYIEPAIGRTRYVFWQGGDVPPRGPAWAINLPVPRIDEVIAEGIFCAGVSNLMLRKVGKRVPIRDGYEQFDGGIAAYFGDNLYGPGYFEDYMVPFDLQKAKQWAEDTRSGVLLGRKFVWNSIGHVATEGHAAILLPSGYVLQAFPAAGLNWDYTIEESHDGGYYQVMVHPENWIDYDGDEF